MALRSSSMVKPWVSDFGDITNYCGAGVHKGGNVGTHNKCVAFDNEVVANLVESELAKAVTRKQKALGSARNHFWKFKSDHRTSSVSSVTSVATHESEAISDSSFTGNRS